LISSAYQSNRPAEPITSALASAKILPCSWVRMRPICSTRSRSRSAVWWRIAARFSTSVERHAGQARADASSASSTSASVASGSSAMPLPVTGLTTVKWSRSSPARQLPSMNNLRSASYPMTRHLGVP
jgi:hypothetical protein